MGGGSPPPLKLPLLCAFDDFNGLFSFITPFPLFTVMEESGLVFPTAADHVLSALDRNNLHGIPFVRFEYERIVPSFPITVDAIPFSMCPFLF